VVAVESTVIAITKQYDEVTNVTKTIMVYSD